MKEQTRRCWLAKVAVLALLAGAFQIGIGLGTMIENQRLRSSYENSSVGWKQELAGGAELEVVRDRRNQEIVEMMQHISMNREIHFADSEAYGEARIAVEAEAGLGCIVTIIRDATGEEIYRSNLIEAGYYIEYIRLGGSLKAGYYPCTAVWSFYTVEDEYMGEAAWKMVVVMRN